MVPRRWRRCLYRCRRRQRISVAGAAACPQRGPTRARNVRHPIGQSVPGGDHSVVGDRGSRADANRACRQSCFRLDVAGSVGFRHGVAATASPARCASRRGSRPRGSQWKASRQAVGRDDGRGTPPGTAPAIVGHRDAAAARSELSIRWIRNAPAAGSLVPATARAASRLLSLPGLLRIQIRLRILRRLPTVPVLPGQLTRDRVICDLGPPQRLVCCCAAVLEASWRNSVSIVCFCWSVSTPYSVSNAVASASVLSA
jgi:hypothetical protein